MGRKPKVRKEVLELLERSSGEFINQSVIHKILGISRSRASEVLQELEGEGLIIRKRLGDLYLVKFTGSPAKPSLNKLIKLGIVWSSEYPFIAPFVKNLKVRYGISTEIKVYDSAVETVRALVKGEVELVLAPLITEVHFYSAFRNLKIIGGGAYDGSAVVYNPRAGNDVIASSYLSTMDALRTIALKKGEVSAARTKYFNHPSDVLRLAIKDRVKYLVVWHPLLKDLIRKGFKEVLYPSELGITYCCTLAASTSLSYELRKKLRREYLHALNKFKRSPSKWFSWYSIKVGISSDVVKDGWRMYKLNPDISKEDLLKALSSIGVSVPDPLVLSTAIDP